LEAAMRIDQAAVGERYARWFSRGLRGIALRYLFSDRGLWVLNTPYRRMLAAAGIEASDRVLDLGCGLGPLLIALSRRVAFETPPVGVDVSVEMIALARATVARAGLEGRIELVAAEATGLPFADHRFEVVVSSHMVKHLDEVTLGRAVAEVARVLQPGGRFLLWEFAPSRYAAPLFWSARATGLPPPFRLRSAAELEAALRQAGFPRVERVATGVFLLPPVPRLALLATRAGS